MVGMTSLLLLSVSTLAFGSPVWPRADNATLTTSSVAFDATLPAISPEIITPSSIAGDFSVAETTSTTTTATASTASASIATAASSSASASASDADGAQLAPLSGTLTVLGEPKDQLLAAYGDGPIDVRVLADLMAANWSAPAPVNLEPQRKKFEGWAKDKWYIDLQYHVAVTECERPKPVVVDVDPFLVCNGGLSCAFTKVLETTQTNSYRYGYKFGLSVEGGYSAPPLSTKVSASFEWSQDWTKTTTKRNSNSYVFNIAAGQVCGPTSIQFSSTCQSTVVIDKLDAITGSSAMSVCEAYKKKKAGNGKDWDGIKSMLNMVLVGSGATPELMQKICESGQIDTNRDGQMILDVTPGSKQEPYTLIGCAYGP